MVYSLDCPLVHNHILTFSFPSSQFESFDIFYHSVHLFGFVCALCVASLNDVGRCFIDAIALKTMRIWHMNIANTTTPLSSLRDAILFIDHTPMPRRGWRWRCSSSSIYFSPHNIVFNPKCAYFLVIVWCSFRTLFRHCFLLNWIDAVCGMGSNGPIVICWLWL